MNWKLTRPGSVTFTQGEPVAMLVPQRRGDLETWAARKAELSSNPALAAGYHQWIASRMDFLAKRNAGDPEARSQKHQKHYFNGKTNEGINFAEHQKKRHLAEFKDVIAPGEKSK